MALGSPPLPQSLEAWSNQTQQQQHQQRQNARLLDGWIDLLAERHGMPRIVLLRQLRHRSHLELAIARLIVAHQEAEPPSSPPALSLTGYTEVPIAPQEALASFDTDAPHKPREQQSDAERAKLDAQTDTILALLKRDQAASAAP